MPRVLDWEALLREHRVPYITSGPNVGRDEIAIRCPFCGSADPSMHMGLNRETGWWSCWRNRQQHSGKSPLRLIMRLLGVPYGVARDIAGLGADYIDPEGFDAMAARLMGRLQTDGRPEETRRRVLRLDGSFSVIAPRGRTRRHYEYLVDARGFTQPDDVEWLGRRYGICAGVEGKWKDRVIIPYYQDDDLVTWTGRAIATSSIRYRDLEVDESILAPKETLFNHDAMLTPGKVLVLVEGPLDALKLDHYGRRLGVRAVALSTNSIQQEQAFLLQAGCRNYRRHLVMMDNAGSLSIADSMRMRQELAFIHGIEIVGVPFGAKDAGDLRPQDVHEWAAAITAEGTDA